ncbi:MAG: hypothetical protein NVS2B8_22050 [Vulcanimicrobiaceae bacterium]
MDGNHNYFTLEELKRNTTRAEIENTVPERIRLEIEYWKNRPSREVIVAWSAFLQSLDEWSPAADDSLMQDLRGMLPHIDDNPVAEIAVTRKLFLSDQERRNVTMPQLEADVIPRLRAQLEQFAMHPPREVIIAWNSYIIALGEWSPGSTGNFAARLRGMLPPIANDPSDAITEGRF